MFCCFWDFLNIFKNWWPLKKKVNFKIAFWNETSEHDSTAWLSIFIFYLIALEGLFIKKQTSLLKSLVIAWYMTMFWVRNNFVKLQFMFSVIKWSYLLITYVQCLLGKGWAFSWREGTWLILHSWASFTVLVKKVAFISIKCKVYSFQFKNWFFSA